MFGKSRLRVRIATAPRVNAMLPEAPINVASLLPPVDLYLGANTIFRVLVIF